MVDYNLKEMMNCESLQKNICRWYVNLGLDRYIVTIMKYHGIKCTLMKRWGSYVWMKFHNDRIL